MFLYKVREPARPDHRDGPVDLKRRYNHPPPPLFVVVVVVVVVVVLGASHPPKFPIAAAVFPCRCYHCTAAVVVVGDDSVREAAQLRAGC
jgi:hypothetical protein